MDFQPKFPAHIFRAYDIRGKLDVMSAELIRAITQALATQYLKTGQTRLAIGYDARQSSPAFAEIIYKECLKQGLDAQIIGCCASPVLYYTARQFDGNGIMVTASHNPKSDNGIKWIMQGEPPLPEAIQQVARDANEYFDSHAEMNWQTLPHQIVPEYCLAYQAALLNDIQLMPQPRPYKVVVDGLYGSAGRCAVLVLKKLGCEVYALRCEANGEFPEHAPDPSQAKHLDLLRNAVQQQHADIGIAFDGDGDRVVLIDEKGVIISADRLLSLFAHMCLADHPAHEVVFDVKCSTMVRNTVLAHHGIPKMIRTGSSFLRKYLAQSEGHAVFGGEYAGHYVFNDGRGFGYDDGLYAALRVLEYLSLKQCTLSEALADYPERASTEDIYISTHQISPALVLANVEKQSQHFQAEMSKIDGVRLDFEDGFGIIRASNTGEYFTVRFDADSDQRLHQIRHNFVHMLTADYPQIAQDLLDAH